MSIPSYDWKQIIKKSRYIDAKNSHDVWCLAIVVDILENAWIIRVIYDGHNLNSIEVVFIYIMVGGTIYRELCGTS